jgi:hypothetical protein
MAMPANPEQCWKRVETAARIKGRPPISDMFSRRFNDKLHRVITGQDRVCRTANWQGSVSVLARHFATHTRGPLRVKTRARLFAAYVSFHQLRTNPELH